MAMTNVLKCIFKPHDGSRKAVQDEVATSRQKVETAASRFESTIRELLHENDTLTGRSHDHAIQIRK